MALDYGLRFERWIADLYTNIGKPNVRHDVTLKKKDVRAQFDVTYGRFRTHYIECKYTSGKNIPLSVVATLHAKLDLFGISASRGVVVTNSDFTPRAKQYALQKKIRLLNGDDIRSLYSSSLGFFARYRYRRKDPSLEQLLR